MTDSDPITDVEAAEWQRACDAATPEPWDCDPTPDGRAWTDAQREADFALITISRTALPRLLAERAAHKEEVRRTELPVPFRCPVCVGTGLVSRPPGVAGDVDSWVSSTVATHPCKACAATGIVRRDGAVSDGQKVPEMLVKLAAEMDGKLDFVSPPMPDGSGFATMSIPLPKDHWLTADPDGFNVPPMPLRMGTTNPGRKILAGQIEAAARYAVRASMMNGKDTDFDPDALVQNMIVGLLGYWTESGLSADEWANPK